MIWYCDDEIACTVQTGHFPEDSDPKVVLEALIPYVKDNPTLKFGECTSKFCDSKNPLTGKVCYEFTFIDIGVCCGNLWYYKEAEYQQRYGLSESFGGLFRRNVQ